MSRDIEDAPSLAEDMGEFFDDPLGFVMYNFDWDNAPLKRYGGPDKWQIDAMTKISDAIKAGVDVESAVRLAVVSGHGAGKGNLVNKSIDCLSFINQRKDIKVWGDLKAGDYVFGQDGKPTKIIQTHPRYTLPVYRVTFDDGSYTDVSGRHEWDVRGRHERRNHIDGWRTLETQEILRLGVLRRNGKALAKQWEIPIQGAVQYPYVEVYDPYIVGMWLGDGSSSCGSVSSTRTELWNAMGLSPNKDTKSYRKDKIMAMSTPELAVHLKEYGMQPVTCDTKFISDVYKFNSEYVRRKIVSGMLDSDGEINRSGYIGYSSTSKRLVEDLIWMVRSLGGKAMMHPAVKKAGYKKDGVFHSCKDAYRCTINFGGLWNPFTHTKKKAALSTGVQHRYLCRWITDIEIREPEEGMCITVENKNGLYLTNDFIVTHNSSLVAWIILWFMSTRPNPQIVVTANTQGQLKTKTWRELSKWHKLSINREWFVWTATKFYLSESPETWFASAIPWTEGNSEAFAGTHEEHVLLIFDEACFRSGTYVMTDNGWKLFEDVDRDVDKLLTKNPETNISEYVKPVQWHEYDHDGIMYEYDNRGGCFSVTPNHKMHYKTQSGKWYKDEIQSIGLEHYSIERGIEWKQESGSHLIDSFKSERKTYPSIEITDMSVWAELMGWYVSEGHCSYINNYPFCVNITQKKDLSVLDRIAYLWGLIGYSAKIYKYAGQVKVCNRGLAEHISRLGRGSKNIRVPNEIRMASKEIISIFLDAFVQGDGYTKSHGRDIMYTSSKQLSLDLQECVLKEGLNSVIREREMQPSYLAEEDRWIKPTSVGYVVSRCKCGTSLYIKRKNIKKNHYKGKVYCAEVPPHNLLLTMRNGYSMWSGNSAIADVIWEVSEGAMTTKGAMWLAFGNPTRNCGRFFQCFHDIKRRWMTMKVDSRDAMMTNKTQLNEWVEDYGEDSDFVRVRVRGVFPRQGSQQFISSESVDNCTLYKAEAYEGSPLVLGVDVARFGGDKTVLTLRQGRKVFPQIKYLGLDTMEVASKIADVITEKSPVATFIDGAGVGGGVVDRLIQLGYVVIDVNFGGSAVDKDRYSNKKAEVWDRMNTYLKEGAEIPDEPDLKAGLVAPEYFYDSKNRLMMESKKDMKRRGASSPDEADSLSFTFAETVHAFAKKRRKRRVSSWLTV